MVIVTAIEVPTVGTGNPCIVEQLRYYVGKFLQEIAKKIKFNYFIQYFGLNKSVLIFNFKT